VLSSRTLPKSAVKEAGVTFIAASRVIDKSTISDVSSDERSRRGVQSWATSMPDLELENVPQDGIDSVWVSIATIDG